jgi:hypothetical protein
MNKTNSNRIMMNYKIVLNNKLMILMMVIKEIIKKIEPVMMIKKCKLFLQVDLILQRKSNKRKNSNFKRDNKKEMSRNKNNKKRKYLKIKRKCNNNNNINKNNKWLQNKKKKEKIIFNLWLIRRNNKSSFNLMS